MSPASGGEQDDDVRSRVRLNIALYAASVLCACLVVLLAIVWWTGRDDADDAASPSAGVGTDVGGGTVSAVKLADESEQKRIAAQLGAARDMMSAFVNIDYEDIDGSLEAVRSRSTGTFLKQYDAASKPIKQLAEKAEATQVGRVVWAGLVAGDQDSATVIVITSGTVANKATDFEKRAQRLRVQMELVLKDGKWLVDDLQTVA